MTDAAGVAKTAEANDLNGDDTENNSFCTFTRNTSALKALEMVLAWIT